MNDLCKCIKSCLKCKDLVLSRSQAVPGDGSVPANILFVGLAPGRNGADITGIPFTRDPSGKLFREMVASVDIKDYFVTNIVKCNPKDSKGRNRYPTDHEILNCSMFLEHEIIILNPSIIVPLGKQAINYFLGPIKDVKSVILSNFACGNRIIIPMYHPSYVIRGAYSKNSYKNDFYFIKSCL